MRKYLCVLALILIAVSCKKKNENEKKIQAVPVEEVKIERFDKLFYEIGENNLEQLKKQYPYFFPEGNEDTVWTNRMRHPLYRELYQEVQKKYPDTQKLQKELQLLFKHIKFYFPEENLPEKVITLISEMDYESRTIYTDSIAIISLDLYLGKDHKFYEFPVYLKENFVPEQIIPDLVTSFSYHKIAPPRDRSLLAQMVYHGKELYLKDLLIPDYKDEEKIGYTPGHLAWAQENEAYIWQYFIDENLLFDTDSRLNGRFITVAPFSKFYLDIDNESPGRIGTWIGWQIVRAYMKNNKNVSLNEMLAMDAKEIFDNSKYKPKK